MRGQGGFFDYDSDYDSDYVSDYDSDYDCVYYGQRGIETSTTVRAWVGNLGCGRNDGEVVVTGGSPGRKRKPWLPLGVMGSGFLLFLFAASGIEDNVWQFVVSGVGLSLVAVGVLLLADERNKGPVRRRRKGLEGKAGIAYDCARECEIEMLRPARYQRKMRIEGGYLNRPPEGMLRLFTVLEDGRFRPQSVVKFDETRRRWSGTVDLGAGPYYSVYVVTALVDTPGRALWDYYFQVGRETDYWGLIEGGFEECGVEVGRFLVEGSIYE